MTKVTSRLPSSFWIVGMKMNKLTTEIYLITATHMKNILSQLLGFDTGEHSEKQVHDGRCANVFDHQVYKVLLLL